jgi:molecular chaperone Hsp33
LGASELLDLQAETLLWRLFHDEGVRILNRQPLRFACSCSRARVEDMLRSLGQDEAMAACTTGQAEIHCDFCGQSYQFSPEQVIGLFHASDATAPGSTLLQ